MTKEQIIKKANGFQGANREFSQEMGPLVEAILDYADGSVVVENTLESSSTTHALSANMGKELNVTKQNAPSAAGTPGQVLQLDGEGKPSWVDPVEGGTYDASMSDESTNAPQNKVVKKYVDSVSDRVVALESIEFGRDLSRIDPVTGRTLQSRTTANSYIIRTAGEYRLPLIYGNAVKDGETNAAAYTRQGSTYTADFVNYKGNPITKPNIEEDTGEVAASAGLLWQTASGMISTVALFEYTDGNYLAFTVANVPSTNGLAVLYIKDANGDIMWSFTIWVVSEAEDLSDIEIVNHTNVTYKLMGLPFGAIWDANHEHYVVPHFQWGRKDAMCPAAAYNSTSNMTLYDISGNTVSVQSYGVADDADAGGTTRSVANSIKMPDKFFLEYDATNYHWNNLTNFNNFWNAAETTNSSLADNQDTAIKTVYDPCPVGWTLPAGRFATGFTTTGDNSSTASQFNVIGSWANGWRFKKNAEDTDGVFFPAAGYRSRTSGALNDVGSYGFWWTFAPRSQTDARHLLFNSGNVSPLDYNRRAYGFGVWPVRE